MTSGVYVFRKYGLEEFVQGEVEQHKQSLDELKAHKRAEVNRIRDEQLVAGFAYDFGDPHGIKVLDTRRVDDRVNWLGGMLIYQGYIAAGNGDVVGAKIRTADNINISLSYKAAAAAISAVGDYANAILNNSWTLKDAINAIDTGDSDADIAAVEAIDITTGWPG